MLISCFYFSVMGEHDRAMASGQRALALATSSGAFDVQVIAQTFLGVAYYAVGDYWQGLDCMRQAIALLPGELYSSRFGLPVLPAVLARGYVAWGLAELGDFVEAASMGEDAVRLARRWRSPPVLPMRCGVLVWSTRRQGDAPHRRSPYSNSPWRSLRPPTS